MRSLHFHFSILRDQLIRYYELDENISMVSWDGKNARGREVGSGIYFHQAQSRQQGHTDKKVFVYK